MANMIAAEIVPQPNRAQSTAKALQQLGFRVLDIGSTVSVQAPAKLWEETFQVSFSRKRKERLSISPGSTTEYSAPEGPVEIPESFRELIADVLFVQPPEFF